MTSQPAPKKLVRSAHPVIPIIPFFLRTALTRPFRRLTKQPGLPASPGLKPAIRALAIRLVAHSDPDPGGRSRLIRPNLPEDRRPVTQRLPQRSRPRRCRHLWRPIARRRLFARRCPRLPPLLLAGGAGGEA